jgi:hypothetical protein
MPDIVLHQQKVGAESALLESSGSSEKWDTERALARSKTAKNRPRGYSINIFEGSKQLFMRLLCFCCNLILKDSVQTEDGIRLCSECAAYIMRYNNIIIICCSACTLSLVHNNIHITTKHTHEYSNYTSCYTV